MKLRVAINVFTFSIANTTVFENRSASGCGRLSAAESVTYVSKMAFCWKCNLVKFLSSCRWPSRPLTLVSAAPYHREFFDDDQLPQFRQQATSAFCAITDRILTRRQRADLYLQLDLCAPQPRDND